MKYFGRYSCTCEHESVCLSGSKKAVESFLYENAIECYQSFEGLHGIRGCGEIAIEDFDIELDMANEEVLELIEEVYNEEIESDIEYSFEPFDENNEEHMDTLNAQSGEFWEV